MLNVCIYIYITYIHTYTRFKQWIQQLFLKLIIIKIRAAESESRTVSSTVVAGKINLL